MKQPPLKIAKGRAKAPAKRMPRRSGPAAAVKSKPVVKRPAPVEVVEKREVVEVARSAKPRQKLIRDSFTMPKADIELIATLKSRAVEGGRPAKKSELLRAGLQVLAALKMPALVKALGALEPIKVGRPAKR